ncbi:PD-(D/E)XK nuclease-like domain-containing protein [Roseomonas xinghualingensis]|uniref:PD-(D/E)XK nuclease-like domain-containing protein n=1 Tax=Roseomonas xinghualingensis TaxID=2986475 RepID=UPI0021F1FC0F|nr:PD-(D/E)XK nuclease-like domain-containing protein [Roseomonas sp. SXEYE001]MCV4210286.1 PD-(D/E)XK nuclease-like domain-containing protein [Roseomonas sp. SXEYE001]
MQPGLYLDLPFDEYQAADAVSVSTLKRFAQAPCKALVSRPSTPSLAFGSLVHCAVLEPHRLEDRYAVTTVERRGTKAWEAACLEAGDRELVKQADMDDALRLRDAVQRHAIARELLSPGLIVEGSLFWDDPETGLRCRARPDGIRRDLKALVDVKSAADASYDEFGRAAAKYRYHWQEPMYRDGIQHVEGWVPDAFIFIVVEKEAPYLVAAYELDAADVDKGRRRVRETLSAYAECKRSGIWPGLPENLQRLTLPVWAD